MKRTIRDVTCRLLAAASFAIPAAHAAEQAQPPSETPAASLPQTIAAPAVVSGHDSQGRITAFADSRGRQFVVAYDESGHVSSVNSPGRLNRLDLPNVSYTADGKLVSVALGDGNVLTFSYDRDGVQYIQDRYGALIRRMPTTNGYIVFSEEDPSTRLRGTVERLDALLKTLANPGAFPSQSG